MAAKKNTDSNKSLESKKTAHKQTASKKNAEASELPSQKDVINVIREVGGDTRKIMANLISVASMNQKKDSMSLIGDSIIRSFDNYKKSVGNHIIQNNVEFTFEMSEDNKSVNEVMFTETVTGPMAGNALNVNVDYFKDLYEQKRDIDVLPAKYKKHEYVEYKYNVATIVEYYTKRFPDILDLFDVFSDMCLNKSDIGVTVEFSDDFIQKFFIDEFQRVLQERQQINDMVSQQAMGIDGLDQSTGQYADFGELDNQLDNSSIYDTTDEELKPILSLFQNIGVDKTSQVPIVPPAQSIPSGKTVTDPMALSGITPLSSDQSDNYVDQSDFMDDTSYSGKTISDINPANSSYNGKSIKNIKLYDSNGNVVNLKELIKSYGAMLFSNIPGPDTYGGNYDDDADEVNIEPGIDGTTVTPEEKQMQVYDQVYKSVIYQYNLLISKVEKKIKKVLDNKLIKKVKYATKIADIYGYSIITVNKTNPDDINIYTPLEVRLYKKKKSTLDMDNFIYGKLEIDGTEQKMNILNHQNNCFVLSLDPMVMMPIPNIVRISWYLYLMDLVEILIIYNDLLKSKSVHLLEIPVFDSQTGYDDGQGMSQNVNDSLSLMNMIINNIESKLVLDAQYIQNSEGTTDTAMQLLKNVGLSVAYVPKLSADSEMKDIKIDTDDNEYDKLYTMLTEKIFAVLKFPLWFRSSAQIMNALKAVPREAVQFAHLVFMSRVNNALSELEDFLEFMVALHAEEFSVSYYGEDSYIPVKLENINIRIRSILGEYLFENYKAEQTRATRVQTLLTFSSAGFQMNPKWAVEYVFPEWTIADVLIDAGATLQNRRTEIENALNGTPQPQQQTDANGNLIQSDMGSDDSSDSSDSTDGSEQDDSQTTTPVAQGTVHKIDWKKVRASFANTLLDISNKEKNQTNEFKNIRKNVDNLIRFKSHSFSIKRT